MFIANQEKNALLEDTISYLTEDGYDVESEVEEMYVVNVGQDEKIYAVVATYNDEPKLNYFYAYKKGTNKIIQIAVVNIGTHQPTIHPESK
ncbi:hypothetical protein CIB95_04990 [Lottiidibacillus patelloidae]|uniref:Uncharacterized protein n=1 Tax=Lottiidibacillus patelloidae TaxID=2670334 RepID=A0A263BVH7_9BACI|nr:hypothetical protein [Lottiidibacillus patelloidae]OZM57724.1 hypothetical protein CIB95_04990 [Lottiidibacillus patelloidae]